MPTSSPTRSPCGFDAFRLEGRGEKRRDPSRQACGRIELRTVPDRLGPLDDGVRRQVLCPPREVRVGTTRSRQRCERIDCASVGGMPVTPRILPRMIACGTIAISPHGANATPFTASPTQ